MGKSGIVTWRSPSNIALVKYWGKCGLQIPCNPSVSMTLSKCYTETTVEYKEKNSISECSFIFAYRDAKNPLFEKKIEQYISYVAKQFPSLKGVHLNIKSDNTFPHAAGIASSASFYSSLALCMFSIEKELTGINYNLDGHVKEMSSLARMGSGSASRSLYGGWVLWGKTSEVAESSDSFAISINGLVHSSFKNYRDSILVVASGEKEVSSSKGHKLMETNPYKGTRVTTAKENTLKFINALKTGNSSEVRNIAEYEAANLHAMFLTSSPGYILIKPETLRIIQKITDFRKETGLECFFTLDAGPNIHLLYNDRIKDEIKNFIDSELKQHCEDGYWIDDKTGAGPERIV